MYNCHEVLDVTGHIIVVCLRDKTGLIGCYG